MRWNEKLSSVYVVGSLVMLAGCLADDSARSFRDSGSRSQSLTETDAATPAADSCMPTLRRLSVEPNNKLDLLFVVDSSASMAGEQAALRRALPGFLGKLTTEASTDLHVGVVSTDMGIPGATDVARCSPDGGDDGRLLQASQGANCEAVYPRFLSFTGDPGDAQKLAEDVSCLASVGTTGCDLAQPLDAALKALTAKGYMDDAGDLVGQFPFRFIATTDEGTRGRGDRENLGFLRADSLLAVVVVSDSEDCSVKRTGHLSGDNEGDLNQRCQADQEALFDVQARFFTGLRSLRPGREDRVVFLAIAGVPSDLVDADVWAHVDFADAAARKQLYANIQHDGRMQVELDPETGAQRPSCERDAANEDEPSVAYPPRRMVELAELFGKNGAVQSICQDDLTPALDVLHDMVSERLGNQCLSRKLARNADGEVDCEVVWAPTQPAAPSQGDGWFYDDSDDSCPRIVFTKVQPPAGTVAELACKSPLSTADRAEKPLHEPSLGTPCDVSGEAACTVVTSKGTRDKSLFCHPELQVCVKACVNEASCAADSMCLEVDGARGYCVDPRCAE